MTTPHLRKSIGRSSSRLALLPIPLVFACFMLSHSVRALSPTPDGLYPGANVAEGGSGALNSLTNGTNNTAIGSEALFSLTGGDKNTAVGAQALKNSVNGSFNTAVGFQALVRADFNADENTATGYRALFSNVAGGDNTAIGFQALYHSDFGQGNTAVGWLALFGNKSGDRNIALGRFAGRNLTFGSDNIDIGNSGFAGEDDTIRIGTSQSATYIAGISGADATGGNEVFVTSDGKLGTVNTPSSARFKENIQPMDKASEVILSLKPVTFRYKKEFDAKGAPQFGLVAEEVVKVNPDLVKRDRDGNLQTVRYEAVNAMLLNEFLKEHRKVQQLEANAAKHEAIALDQQKAIDALTASLKEQKALIHKVSDKVELNRPAPQMAVNNQ